MGIKKLYEFLREKEEELKTQIFFYVPVTRFAGRRIAVDMNILMNKDLAIATGNIVRRTNLALGDPDRSAIIKEWIIICLRKVISFLMKDITPILIPDGKSRPEKKAIQEKKLKDRADKQKRIVELTSRVRSTPHPNKKDLDELESLWKYNFKVTKEETDLLYNIFTSLGLPCMRAKHDGEELCSVLTMEGFCEAVWSTDQDCMVFGAPLAIIDKEIVKNPDGGSTECFKIVDLQHTLNVLKLSFDEFQDLCILAGCDFNSNIPGFAIKKAYPFYKKGGTRAIFDKFKEKTKCLNFEDCKRVFRLKVWEEVCTTNLNLFINQDIAKKYGRKVLEPYDKDTLEGSKGMDAFYESIMSIYQRIPVAQMSRCRNPIKPNVVLKE